MKQILLLSLFFTSSLVIYAQDYSYSFKIEQVTNLAEAKEVTKFLRPHFNTEEEPNQFFPAFNVELQRFHFISDILTTKEDLYQQLLDNGYLLLDFSRSKNISSPISIEQ